MLWNLDLWAKLFRFRCSPSHCTHSFFNLHSAKDWRCAQLLMLATCLPAPHRGHQVHTQRQQISIESWLQESVQNQPPVITKAHTVVKLSPHRSIHASPPVPATSNAQMSSLHCLGSQLTKHILWATTATSPSMGSLFGIETVFVHTWSSNKWQLFECIDFILWDSCCSI